MRNILLLLPLLLTASALDGPSLRGKEDVKVEVDAKKLKENKNKLKERLAKQTAGKSPMRRRFRKQKSLASVLFPGVAPEEYFEGQEVRFKWSCSVSFRRSVIAIVGDLVAL